MKDKFDLDDLFETKLDELSEDKPAAAVPQKPVVTQTAHSAPELKVTYVNHPNGDAAFAPLVSSSRFGCLWPAGIAMIALAVGFVLGLLFASWRGSDGEVVEPDTDPVDGAYVAIFYNDTDLSRYTESQREFLNSVNTANYLEERKVNWKKIDTQPLDISKLETPFQVMSEKHRSKEPWIVIASGKKFASEPIESNDQAMKLLQKWIK